MQTPMRRSLAFLTCALAAGCGGPPAPPPASPAAPTPAGHAAGAGHHDHHGHHGHDGHGPLVHRFEDADRWAKEFDDPARDAWQRPAEVVASLAIAPGMTVADVGAGTGYFLPHLSRAVGPSGVVLALDIEPDMVRYVRERAAREGLANVRAAVVAGDDPHLPPSGVHRILIVDTWHHIPDRVSYAGKLRAGLAEGGVIAVVDFTKEADRGPPREHRLAAEDVVAELTKAGLTASIAREELPDQYVVLARR